MTERERLETWYLEQQTLFTGNEEALYKLKAMYAAKSRQLDVAEKNKVAEQTEEALEEQFEFLDEHTEALIERQEQAYEALQELHDEYFMTERERLETWYLEQQTLFTGNEEALYKLKAIYAAKIRQLDVAEKHAALSRSADFFGNMATIAAAFGKKGAGIAKAFAISETIINTYKAATGAYSALASIPFVGPALGIAAAAAAIASGLANVQKIRNTEIKGIAHGGMTSVPAESTYILNKGERVLSPNQNKDLTDFMHGGGQPVNQTNNFTLFPNATNTESLLTIPVSRWKEVCESRIIPAMRQLNWGAY